MSAESEKLAEGTLISHLLELRNRLIRALLVVGVAFMPCAYYSNEIFEFVSQPLIAKLRAVADEMIAETFAGIEPRDIEITRKVLAQARENACRNNALNRAST